MNTNAYTYNMIHKPIQHEHKPYSYNMNKRIHINKNNRMHIQHTT